MWYPPADLTPTEFEEWVARVFKAAGTTLDGFEVTLGDRVKGSDGSYNFDATVRFEWAGVRLFVIIEAKMHTNPIKRELVQILHSKVASVGAHKGILVSTAQFQEGALEFARAHGIALIRVTEGRFTIEMKSLEKPPAPSREAAARFGVEPFVGHWYEAGNDGGIRRTTISPKYPEYTKQLLGIDAP